MIRKIANTPLKRLTHNNPKITDEKDKENHVAETLSENSSAKNQRNVFKSSKQKQKSKNEISKQKH